MKAYNLKKFSEEFLKNILVIKTALEEIIQFT
jgi:hypothetical protein